MENKKIEPLIIKIILLLLIHSYNCMKTFQNIKPKKRSYPYYKNESNFKLFYPTLKTDCKN